MASSFLQAAISFCLLLLLSGSCLASKQSSPESVGQGECNIQKLNPLEPGNRIRHEAGYTETWDENEQQLQCAGIAVTRHVIQNRGLLVPSFNNAPSLIFVLEGRGILGAVFPGCPETFQSFQQDQQRGQREPSFGDQHQKVHSLEQGDVAAMPTGVVHWAYNQGNEELVLLVVHDISNRENQLDQNLRRFFFAGGNPQEQQQEQTPEQEGQQGQQSFFGANIFPQLDTEFFARAFGVPPETMRKLQKRDDRRGFIIRVREGLRVEWPGSEDRRRQPPVTWSDENGYEETLCTIRLKENLINPERADIYTARGGSISTLNSFNLPILHRLRLSAARGHLRPNAMVAPHWYINAHSVMYVTRGSGRVQVAGHSRRTAAFEGEIRKGQLFIVPQNFVQLKQAGQQSLEWVTFLTNENAKTSAIVGRTGVFRGIPIDVWVNSYQDLSREEAWALKYNRKEVSILDPEFNPESQQKGSPWSIV